MFVISVDSAFRNNFRETALRRRRDGGRPGKRRRQDCVEARACSRNNWRLNLKQRSAAGARDAATPPRRNDDVGVVASCQDADDDTSTSTPSIASVAIVNTAMAINLVNDRIGRKKTIEILFWLREN